MNCSVKNLFSKCEHISIKLRIYLHLLKKYLTENYIFCVANIIGFTTESCKFLFKSNFQFLVYFTSINTVSSVSSSEINFCQVRKSQNNQHRNYCTIINILLEHRTFFKVPMVKVVPRNLQVNCLTEQFLDTIKRGLLLQRETFC